jgi:hypothetical protein
MFKVKLWITVLLYIVAGALLVVLGTPRLHEALIPPFEVAADGAARVVSAELALDSETAVTAAARLTVDAKVVAAAKGAGELDDEAKKAMLATTERLGAPKFAAVVRVGGAVAALVGEGPKLGDNVAGLPILADAETGVMRDGMLDVDGATWLLGAAPVYDGAGAVAGTVLVGWPRDAAYVDRLGQAAKHPVVLVSNGDRLGSSLSELDANTLGGAGTQGVGPLALDLPLPLPLPLLVPETTRYVAASTPALGQDKAKYVALVDRNGAFQTIAVLQLAVLGATLLPGFVIFLLVLNILRSISKPMQQIMDHLSAYAQGTAVGILPEGALSGPFVRLGKQINMILQAPPPGAAPRGGASPLSPPSSSPSNNGELGLGGLGGLGDGPPAAPFTDPATPDAEEPSFDGIPGLGAGEDSGGAPLAQPPVSDDLEGSALSSLFDDGGGGGGDPLAAFRVDGNAGGPPPPPGAAPLPGGGPPTPPPATEPPAPADGDGGVNPEATVMFQVPDQLIQESAQTSTAGEPAAPPVGSPPPSAAPPQEEEARTVIAQVPAELLNQAASVDRITPEEEDHFKEVYEEFVKTRQQCGEDTDQLTYERFTAKLMKNRKSIIEKYNSKSVRFQVYVKQGKAALRAVPVRG